MQNSKPMTAIEWLVKQMKINNYINENAWWLIEEAKEMEKKQIIDAVEWNYKSNMGEVYYNATYKKKTK